MYLDNIYPIFSSNTSCVLLFTSLLPVSCNLFLIFMTHWIHSFIHTYIHNTYKHIYFVYICMHKCRTISWTWAIYQGPHFWRKPSFSPLAAISCPELLIWGGGCIPLPYRCWKVYCLCLWIHELSSPVTARKRYFPSSYMTYIS